jgi:hypothetical protein
MRLNGANNGGRLARARDIVHPATSEEGVVWQTENTVRNSVGAAKIKEQPAIQSLLAQHLLKGRYVWHMGFLQLLTDS